MNPALASLLISGAGTLGQSVSNIGKTVTGERDREKYEKYRDRMEQLKKRETYRNAMARALGSSNPYVVEEPSEPLPSSTMAWDLLGGIGGGLMGLGQMAQARSGIPKTPREDIMEKGLKF